MGWTGALAGLGKGMMDYATIMGEQRKNDWIMQRDFAMNQRNLELEELRNKNNLRVAEYQDTKAIERDKLNFSQLKEENDIKFAQGIVQRKEELGERMLLEDAQFNRQLTKQQAAQSAQYGQQLALEAQKNRMNITNQIALAKNAIEMKDEQRAATLEEFNKSVGDSVSKEVKAKATIGIMFPEILPLLTSENKVNADLMERQAIAASKTFTDAVTAFPGLDEDTQKKVIKQTPKGENPAFFYGRLAVLSQNKAFNEVVDKGQKDSSDKLMTPAEQGKKLQKDVLSGLVPIDVAREKVKGTPLEQYLDAIDTTGRLNRPNTMMENAGEVWNSSVADPAVRAGSAIWKFGGRNVENDGLIRTNTF